jgi:hypothetical protein
MRAVAVLVVSVVGVAGCATKRNPNACCTNAVECAEVGFEEITPCLGVEVCVEGTCEAPTCTTSVDCPDPAAPFCVGNLCTSTCDGDESCFDPSAPYCNGDGACVECRESAECEPDAPVCDSTNGSCRGCLEDDECATGICLAFEGHCVTEDEAVFVSGDGVDAGQCQSGAPCATISYALGRVTSRRRVLRIESLDYFAPQPIVIDRDVYLDTAGTRLSSAQPGTTITFTNFATAVIENVRLRPGTLLVNDGAEVVAYGVELEGGSVSVGESGNPDRRATLRFVDGTAIEGSRAFCDGLSKLEVQNTEFDNSKIQANFCELYVGRNRFVFNTDSPAIYHSNFMDTLVENNFIHAVGSQTGFVSISTPSPGSFEVTVRYNTMIYQDEGDPPLIGLSAPAKAQAIVLTSNVLVSTSSTTVGGSNYVVDHCLTNGPVLSGEGNVAASVEEIFVDLATGDYRPAASSPARGAGDPAQDPGEDIDGNPRPVPAGSPPDVGAFEVE